MYELADPSNQLTYVLIICVQKSVKWDKIDLLKKRICKSFFGIDNEQTNLLCEN